MFASGWTKNGRDWRASNDSGWMYVVKRAQGGSHEHESEPEKVHAESPKRNKRGNAPGERQKKHFRLRLLKYGNKIQNADAVGGTMTMSEQEDWDERGRERGMMWRGQKRDGVVLMRVGRCDDDGGSPPLGCRRRLLQARRASFASRRVE